MSIKPIDHQTTLINSINESKVKHTEFQKIKDNAQHLQFDLQNQIKRDQKKVSNSEHCNQKRIDKKNKDQSQNKNKNRKKKKRNNEIQKPKQESKKVKGQNLDIFI